MVCMAEQENRTENSREELIRVRISITGIVQGVGFRPFVYKLAKDNKLRGTVLNNERGVRVDVEGYRREVEAFLEDLNSPPPIAMIESIRIEHLPPCGYKSFTIEKSKKGGSASTFISPDVAVCKDCLQELFDPGDRRYRYPFINCTNCGPRFTIIKNIPYDRPYTTMAPFQMCDQCKAEYFNPLDRRFHAQPIACPACGPHVSLLDRHGQTIESEDAIRKTATLLKEGAIVAIKGLGGYHLACDAYNDNAVKRLRQKKYREDKPFALMCRDIETAGKLCILDESGKKDLLSPQSPIVILPKKKDIPVSPAVAPGHNFLGIMLPYTPLHHLILSEGPESLVMTSGNLSDEPIVYRNEDALERLKNIADYFLVNNRDIYVRCDDSVIKPFRGKKTFLRRARGYVPFPVVLKKKLPQVLACGGELKNTFCLTKNRYAFLSHHIGDLENWETLKAFEQSIEHFKKLFEIDPEVVVHDLHPDYLSTQYAMGLDLPRIGVQHHFAHALSCMAEYGLAEPLLAVIMDGTGYGEDGTIWGCEFLSINGTHYRRLGHLRYIPLPGGEKAIKEPWRVAASYLDRIYGSDWLSFDLPISKKIDHNEWNLLKRGLKLRYNSPQCSSAGRLFDAVSAILGIRHTINYEGQAAIELEQLASSDNRVYPYKITNVEEKSVIDPDPLIEAIVEDVFKGEDIQSISGRFHLTLAQIIIEMAVKMRDLTSYSDVILSGGVFQNHFLLELTCQKMEERGFKAYINRKVPANDGGISLGQAYYILLRDEE